MVTQIRNRAFARVAASLPVEIFKALADPNRISLVAWLAAQRGSKTVSEIVDSGCCPVDFSVVSRHLRTLHAAGIVDAERSGREVRYQLEAARLSGLLRRIADLLDTCCPPPKKETIDA
jgi:ArsR family transcriptional regulator